MEKRETRMTVREKNPGFMAEEKVEKSLLKWQMI